MEVIAQYDGLGGDELKRRRVEKACETCRRRKERCNGVRPTCSNCQAAARECVYSSEIKRRGLPEGWVRALEKCWALVMLRAPNVDQDIVATIKEHIRNPLEGGFAALWTDETHDRGLFSMWKGSQLSRELEDLLPILENLPRRKLDETLPLRTSFQFDQVACYSLTPSTPAQLDANPTNVQVEEAVPASYPRTSTQDSGHQNSLSGAPGYGSLPADALASIDAYFDWTNIWFPIVERHQVYRTYHQWSEKSTEANSGDQACLLAIIAYQRSQHNKTGRNLDYVGLTVLGNNLIPFSVWVQDLIPKEYRRIQLAHIQALLILSLAYLGARLCDDAWLLVGQATRLALLERTVEAHRARTSEIGLESGSQSRLLHVLYGCIVLDSVLSAVAALPSHLGSHDLSSLGRLNEDGPEEWTPVAQLVVSAGGLPGPALAISTFNRLFQITLYLNRAMQASRSSTDGLNQLALVEADVLSWDEGQRIRLREVLDTGFNDTVLPHQLTVHQLHLVTLVIIAARSTILHHDLSGTKERLSLRLSQLVDLLTKYALDLDSRAMPPIWELVLSLMLNEIEIARKLCNFEVPLDLIETLQKLVDVARMRWPTFEPLHARMHSYARTDSAQRDVSMQQEGQFT